MRKITPCLALSLFLLSSFECSQPAPTAKKFKGRLEIAGICMNYTIGVLEGGMDTAFIVSRWTDEITQKTYQNVFRLGNPCDFPENIKQGDEFYFYVDTIGRRDCAVCLAYYPTPPKALSIKVVKP